MSKSYAVLAGIEGYGKAKRTVRTLHQKVDNSKHKIQHSLHATGNNHVHDHDRANERNSLEAPNGRTLPFHTKKKDVHSTADDQYPVQ